MKQRPDSEKENEKLNDVTFEQATGLHRLGFDWNCGFAFDKDGNDVNWTTKQFYCWKPTIELALRFMRKRYGMYHQMYIRSWSKEVQFGFSISHAMESIDCMGISLQEESDNTEDNIVSFDFDEALSIALNQQIRYLLKDLERDFSWLTPGAKAYIGRYNWIESLNRTVLMADTLDVLERNDSLRTVKVSETDCKTLSFWIHFHKLHYSPELAIVNKD